MTEPAAIFATDTPALECPEWCTVAHQCEHAGPAHQLLRRVGPEDDSGQSWVSLFMTDWGKSEPVLADLNGQIHIHLTAPDGASVIKKLGESEDCARMAEVLGRADIAATIREVAELGRNTDVRQKQDQPQRQP